MPNASALCARNGHMFPAPGNAPSKVAVLVDVENFHAARFDQAHGQGAYVRSKSKGEQYLDLGSLTTVVEKAVGQIAVYLAFMPFNFRYSGYREDMVKHLVTPVPIITSTGTKNGVDMALACHAMKLACTDATFTHFVLASLDLDFAVPTKVLRDMGKVVIGLGIEGVEINPLWISSCNAFLYLPTKKPKGRETGDSSNRPNEMNQEHPRLTQFQKGIPRQRELNAKVKEYKRILEKDQIRLPPPEFRATVFETIAAHLASQADGLAMADGSCGGLEALIRQAMGISGIELTAREVSDLGLLFQKCGLVRHDRGRWNLVVEPCLDAMDFELARAVLKTLVDMTTEPNLNAVCILLFGRPNSPAGDFLKELLREVITMSKNRNTEAQVEMHAEEQMQAACCREATT